MKKNIQKKYLVFFVVFLMSFILSLIIFKNWDNLKDMF
jgi:hypothetical protein